MNTTPRLRRMLSLVAGLAAASIALSSCVYLAIPEESVRPTVDRTQAPPDTTGIAPELLRFYEQQPNWYDCGDGFDCAEVTAPLDWQNPDAGDITIAMLRHRSPGEPIGSLLVNPGGPGGSGIEFVRNAYSLDLGGDLAARYDIVGFDPRGVGASTAVKCFEPAEMDSYLFDLPQNPRGSPEWEEELLEAGRAYAAACEANSGGILAHISTVNSARDMDLLRAVLGDEKLNYLGFSYGTFLGATYASLYPERVGRLVLDGAVDPSISGFELGTTQAVGFESALRTYMADCLAGPECPFAGTVDDAMTDLAALLASVDARPLSNGDGRMLGADSLMTAIVVALYNQANWEYLTLALADALGGDPFWAFLLADFYWGREDDGSYGDNSTEAFNAYNCIDYPSEDDPAAEEAALAKIRSEAPTIAPYWEGPDLCSVWPHPPTGTRGPIHAPGTPPILVIGTTGDPATPYHWSVALAEQLEGGVLITYVGEGHTAYGQGSFCIERAVDAFFLEDVIPVNGLRCES